MEHRWPARIAGTAAGLANGLFGGGGGGGRGGNGDGCGGSGLNVEGLLEELHEVGELDEGHFLESCDELVIGELSHEWHPS